MLTLGLNGVIYSTNNFWALIGVPRVMLTAGDAVIENVRKNKFLALNSDKSKEERDFCAEIITVG